MGFSNDKKGGQLGRVKPACPRHKKTLGCLAVYNSRKPDGKDFQLHYTSCLIGILTYNGLL